MTIASDLFRTITVKINDISQQLPYIVVNQADDNGKIIRFVPLDNGQKVTGFTGARLYYPPRSDNTYGDYVTGVESDGAWDFTIPVGALSAGRVGCNLAFIDGDGETYSRNVVFLVEPAVSGVFDPEDGQQTRIDKIIGTVQDTADTAIDSVNKTAESISKSVTDARASADAAANSEQQAAASVTAAQNAVNGFGLQAGATTTGEPGTDAAVEIQKTGTKYTANFTIPRGEKGADGAPGKDGTGVTILGAYDSLESLKAEHPTGNLGDSYLVNGNLYVWDTVGSDWNDVGTIQGPKGDKGDPGTNGTDGAPGKDGIGWSYGRGVPASTGVPVGSLYLDLDTGNVYAFTA